MSRGKIVPPPVWVKVVSWSMSPFIKKGDKLLVGKTAPGDIRIGDVICFKNRLGLIAHRIYAIQRGAGEALPIYITKPDAGERIEPVAFRQILGKARLLKKNLGIIDIDKQGSRLWTTILLLSYRIYPRASVYINKKVGEVLKSHFVKRILSGIM